MRSKRGYKTSDFVLPLFIFLLLSWCFEDIDVDVVNGGGNTSIRGRTLLDDQEPQQIYQKQQEKVEKALEPPKGYPWHRWGRLTEENIEQLDEKASYPLNIEKFISILSRLGAGETVISKRYLGYADRHTDFEFVRLVGISHPYIVRHGKVLRPHGSDTHFWSKYAMDIQSHHIDWVTLLEGAVSMAKGLEERDERMKMITQGDFPIIFNPDDLPFCGDDLVPIFRTNAIKDEEECQYSWPSMSIMYYLSDRKSSLRDSPQDWDAQFDQNDIEYPWGTKQKKAVWRGQNTGYDYVYEGTRTPRSKLQDMVLKINDDSILDVKFITKNPGRCGGTEHDENEMEERDFMNYRAILDLDGWGWSSRTSDLLCMNSVLIKVEPTWINYWENELIPGVHFLSVNKDLSDLEKVVAWAVDDENQEEVKGIIKNANDWCRMKMTLKQYTEDFMWTLLAYAELLANAPGFLEKWNENSNAYNMPGLEMAEFEGKFLGCDYDPSISDCRFSEE